MKKTREILLTRHFNMDLDEAIGKLILIEGEEIPIDSVITFGGEIIKHADGTESFRITEASLVQDQHYKNFLDAYPDSCIQAGGHVRGENNVCQLCKAQKI